MSDEQKTPRVGEWTAWAYGYDVRGPVTKITAQKVWWGPRSAYLDGVKFSGSEAACQALKVRLDSSQALMNQERSASHGRHVERVAKLVAEAEQ